jgi:hypothetical protein
MVTSLNAKLPVFSSVDFGLLSKEATCSNKFGFKIVSLQKYLFFKEVLNFIPASN